MKNPRRQILVNPRFQLKFTLLLTLIMFLVSMALPLSLLSIYDKEIITSQFFVENPRILMLFQQMRGDLIERLVIFQLLFLLVFLVTALLHSHRIAGPLYKLKISMIALRQGMLNRHVQFRKKDNFTELADEFNAMVDALSERRQKDLDAVHSVIPKLNKLSQSLQGEARDTLKEAINTLDEINRGLNK